jgi:hypothetical protein
MSHSRAKPHAIRRAALISYSKGSSQGSICKRFEVTAVTLRNWAKGAKVEHGSNYTPNQIDALIARQRESIMQEDLDLVTDPSELVEREKHVTMTHGPAMDPDEIDEVMSNPPDAAEVAEALRNKAEIRKNMVITEKSTIKKAMEELMDPAEFERYLQARFAQIVARIEQESTLEGQVNAVVTGGLLTSIAAAIRMMPPITTWADFERAVKLLRLTLNMDENKGVASNGADLTVLNQAAQFDKKSRRGKVVDVPA